MTVEDKEKLVKLLARLKHLVNNSHIKPENLYNEEELEELLKETDDTINKLCDGYFY